MNSLLEMKRLHRSKERAQAVQSGVGLDVSLELFPQILFVGL